MKSVNLASPESRYASGEAPPLPRRGAAHPLLKWAGGKRKLIAELARYVPQSFGTYHEPFFGGGALYFHLAHEPSIISDLNADLVSTYEAIRDDPDAVVDVLGTFTNTAECYYAARTRNFSIGRAAERAADFVFTNRVGFNGLFRQNTSGRFNVPFGRSKNPTICDSANLHAVSRMLRGGTTIVHGDFSGVLDRARPGDFAYCDPPYVPVSETSSFTGYQKGGFGYADHVRLRDVALELRARGVSVLLSNSFAPPVLELYKAFEIHVVEAPRSINSKADGRGLVKEVLIR